MGNSNSAELGRKIAEHQQTVSTLERQVHALTGERDRLRIEQNKKDEIISRVMGKGEELSKKQAAQESTISKLRAQIREFEEQKKELITKLEVKEKNVESIKRDKAAIEKLLQETIETTEKNHAEVYALTSERDTLRIEQNKRDEIISRVMGEGEELSKKQAAQESTINELRAQIREFEEQKKKLITMLEVEEKNVKGIKRDNAATEKMPQETIEKNPAEVYALTRERDTLRIEQNKTDEIRSRVMAEGEELSKKQAAQESTINKLRAQIREFEEQKKELITKLEVEEKYVKSIKRDNDATETLPQDTIVKNHDEVYAITSERDTLPIEQNKMDEISSRVMTEGEELSKKQADPELTISKLRAKVREFEEQKKELITKLEVDEKYVKSIKRDKATTEKLPQETIMKNHAEVYALTSERDTLPIEQNKEDEIGSRVMAEGEEISKEQAAQELTISKLRAQIREFEEQKKELITKLEVYALTSETDTLPREQNKTDEISSRVITEGEELSKKQAAPESTISKLRAQVREFEEQKKELITKLEVEEEYVKSIKRDKAATEKLPQEIIEKNHAEVYALTSERHTLPIEQNKTDEISSQVMAEGEELSKKQAAQESTISKLRAQIREFEEQKKELITKLEVEEKYVKSIKRDKAATEKLPQDTIEKNNAKVYALMSERDTLPIEQNKMDEISSQVMTEGEEFSKKQASPEMTISKLRAQVREFEEQKKELITKLEVEEKNVKSIKRDKAATEKLPQETIEKYHAEVTTQKEYHTMF